MYANLYHGKKVLVTGHTGFKGSWLCAWLLNLGAEVTGFALDIPTEPSCYRILQLEDKLRDIRGDIRDAAAISKVVKDLRPDFIFHLAAQAIVRASYAAPHATFQTNAGGTLNMLEAIRESPGIGAAVIVTSDKCYHNNEWIYGYREIDPLGGSDPYSASKGCAEFIAHSYFVSFFQEGPSCATARAGNVIGGGDWAADRIVPDCARSWYEQKPVEIRSPHATRPWQHVLEPLSGYLWLGAMLYSARLPGASPAGESFNFGPHAEAIHPVADLVKSLERQWPGFSCHFADSSPNLQESSLLKLCCDKALAELEWKATWDFEESVRATADWYARYKADHAGMWDYTQGQIAAYCTAAQSRNLAWSLT